MSLEVDITARQGSFNLEARFSCGPGITALFGRSGAGKSTLAHLIAGLIRPERGHIRLQDRELVNTTKRLFLPPHKRRIGYVFQEARLFPHLSVKSNLLYGRWFAGRREDAEFERPQFERIVALLGLGPLLQRRPLTLSGGEQQRTAIGRALLSAPQALILDEPLAALDVARKEEILPYIERLRDEAGIPIVYISHAVAEVTRLAAHVVMLNQGRVEASGRLEEIAARLDPRPLAGRFEAGAVLGAEVLGHDEAWNLTRLSTLAGPLLVPRLQRQPGETLNIRIRARDVTLHAAPPGPSSALNMLPGIVAEIMPLPESPAVDVRLDCNGLALIARITRLSAHNLQLAPGMAIFAAVKTVAMDRRGLTGLTED